jgi:hypothetical protein
MKWDEKMNENSQTRRRHRPGRRWAAVTLAAVLGGLSVLLAACSSGGTVPVSSSAVNNSASSGPGGSGGGSVGSGNGGITVAFSQCMRDHGITDFPDPNSDGSISGSGSASGNPLNPMSPQFQEAQQDCQKYLQGGGASSSEDQAQEVTQALEVTTCMRDHGYPQFPDPVVSNGNISWNGSALGAVGSTPAFQNRLQTCQASVYGGGSGTSGSSSE